MKKIITTAKAMLVVLLLGLLSVHAQQNNNNDPVTSDCPAGYTRYSVSNGSPAGQNYHVWMPSLFIEGQTARMTFEKEAYLDIKNDGSTAHLYGYATVTGSGGASMGNRYLVDVSFKKAGSATGPKITNPTAHTPEVTSKWQYFVIDDTKATITSVNGNQVFKLTHMPANEQFGLQVGQAASTQSLEFGLGGWFFWEEVGTGRKGTGDFFIKKITNLCPPQTCPDDETIRYNVSNGSPAGQNYHVWMPSLFIEGQTARMTFDKDAYLDIKKDGSSAHLYGYATVTGSGGASMGNRYLVDVSFTKAGSATGPKITDPAVHTPEVTSKWQYFIIDDSKATISAVEGNQVFKLTHMPANQQFGFQVGEAASTQSLEFGLGGWFFWEEVNTGRKGTGDFFIKSITSLCPEPVEPPVCEILVNGKPLNNNPTINTVWNGQNDKVTVKLANITEPVNYTWKLTFPTDPSVPAVTKSGTFTQDGTYEVEIPIPAKGKWGNVSADGSGRYQANVSFQINTPCGGQNWTHVYYAPNKADVKVVKTVDKSKARVGEELTYKLVVTNNGPRSARGVVLTDVLPYGLEVLSVTGGTLRRGKISLGTMAVNESKTIVITTRIVRLRHCKITNVATVCSASPVDPDLSNNKSQACTVILPQLKADVKVIPRSCPRTIIEGCPVTYYFTVKNYGPSTAENVTIKEVIPQGATLLYSNARSIRSLGRGAYTTVKVTVRMNEPGIHNISVNASSTTFDPNLANNKATTPVRVRARHCPSGVTNAANVKILPNPVRTYLGVDVSELYRAAARERIHIYNVSVNVTSMYGRHIGCKTVSAYGNKQVYFNMRYQRNGLYIADVVVTYKENGRMKRIVLKKRIMKR